MCEILVRREILVHFPDFQTGAIEMTALLLCYEYPLPAVTLMHKMFGFYTIRLRKQKCHEPQSTRNVTKYMLVYQAKEKQREYWTKAMPAPHFYIVCEQKQQMCFFF